MKKFVSLFLVLLLCMSVLAASLRAVCDTAAADTDPKPTVTVVPSDPDGLNTVPPDKDTEGRE